MSLNAQLRMQQSPVLLSHRPIPQIAAFTPAKAIRPAQRKPQEQSRNAPARLRSQTPPRCDHRLGQHHAPTVPFQRPDPNILLRRIVRFTESTSGIEPFSRTKQAGPSRRMQQPPHHEFHQGIHDAEPQRQPSLKLRHTASTGSTVTHSTESRTDHFRCHKCIGIHKKQNVATRLSCPRIARGRNLPVLNSDGACSKLAADGRGRIRRCVIHNDDFIRLLDHPHCHLNSHEAPTEPGLLIVSWNDE